MLLVKIRTLFNKGKKSNVLCAICTTTFDWGLCTIIFLEWNVPQDLEKYKRPFRKTLLQIRKDKANDTVILVSGGKYLLYPVMCELFLLKIFFLVTQIEDLWLGLWCCILILIIFRMSFGCYFAYSKNNDASILTHKQAISESG